MGDYSKYIGRFGGRNGLRYEIEIKYPKRSTLPTTQVVRLGVPPVVISYQSSDKLDPIVISRCQVSLWCDADGRYQHLYSTSGRDVSLEVYERDADGIRGDLVWFGTIDPEVYEEPHSRPDGYFVSLGFSDLGCLKRQRHSLRGLSRISSVIGACAAASLPLWADGNRLKAIASSTYLEGGGMAVGNGAIDTALYTDDAGKPKTYWDVLGGLLRSLRLRIEQRGGRYIVYDNESMLKAAPVGLSSGGSDSVMIADKIYNNVQLETPLRLDAAIKEVEIDYTGRDYQDVSRLDVDETVAYQYNQGSIILSSPYSPSPLSVRVGRSRSATVGQSDTFIALVSQPDQPLGLIAKCVGRATREEVKGLRAITRDQGARCSLGSGKDDYYSVISEVSGVHYRVIIPPAIPRRGAYPSPQSHYSGAMSHFGSPSPSTPVYGGEIAISGVELGKYDISVSLSMLVGFGVSLYQGYTSDATHATYRIDGLTSIAKSNNDDYDPQILPSDLELYRKLTAVSRGYLYIHVRAWDSVNGLAYDLVQESAGDGYTYRWQPAVGDVPTAIRVQFGGVDGMPNAQWVACNEVVHTSSEDLPEPRYQDKGLILPSPPCRSYKLDVRLNEGFDLTFRHRVRRLTHGASLHGVLETSSDVTSESLIREAIKVGAYSPNYVLAKDLKISLVRRDGRKEDGEPVKTTADISSEAYEPYTVMLDITTEPYVEDYSPALLRRGDGTPYKGTLISGDNRGTIHELYTQAVLGAYGRRTHILEGTYRAVLEHRPLSYHGAIYMRLGEEIDLRSGNSRMTLAEIRRDATLPDSYRLLDQPHGEDGISISYDHLDLRQYMVYAKDPDGADMSATSQVGRPYLGISRSPRSSRPTDPYDYIWTRISAESLHIEYSQDGSTGWHIGGLSTDRYIRHKVGDDGIWSEPIRIAGEDAVQVQIWSKNGLVFSNGQVDTELVAFVYRGAQDISDSIAPSAYSWERISSNPDTDRVWASLHQGVGRVLHLSSEDVVRRASFNVIVSF